jgi:LCP family protein required for cell wall assembly
MLSAGVSTASDRTARPSGCLSKLLFLIAGLFLTPVFCCGLSLVVYMIVPPPHMNILVMGVDGRQNEGFISRTDSVMLFGVSPARLRVSMLSIPRDVFIQVPGYGLQRVNTVNMLGEEKVPQSGPALLAQSMRASFNIHVDRYVRLNFNSFVELIDAVGGITIDVDKAIVDDAYPTDDYNVTTVRFESGIQHMDGKRALMFARTRHSDDDYQRAKRQQQVVTALLTKVANPANWPAILRVLNQSMDSNLTVWDMVGYMPPIVLNVGHFDQLVIDRNYLLGTAKGHAVPNYELLIPWMQGRFN